MVQIAREKVPRFVTQGHEASPLISIGMPAFNCENSLATAIRSILNQSYDNWELLLIEDGSEDRTLEVARRFRDPRISVITDHAHEGLVPRLNQAVAMSRGKYFARMDADDVSYPDRLERQVEYLERHPEIDLLGCGMLIFEGNGAPVGDRPMPGTHEEICRRPWDGFYIPHATWMGRTVWFRARPYDAKAVLAEDQVLLLRSYLTSCFACLPEILYGCREELVLRKILCGRYGFATVAVREFIKREKYVTAAGVFLKQVAKAIVDVLAIQTGLNYILLAHRARPLSPASCQRWAEVWSQLQDANCAEPPVRAALEF
jgi:glycosyltransferase involved in cell wall biosynthesis